MTDRIEITGLRIAPELHDFVVNEAVPGTGIDADAFWTGFATIVKDLPKNRALLKTRDEMQEEVDAWYRANGAPNDMAAHSDEAGRAVIYNRIVFLAGMTATDRSQDVRGQTRQTLERIDSCLAEAGTDKHHLLSAQIWLKDIARDFDAMNELWDAWTGPNAAPTRATAQCEMGAPNVLVEIIVTAALPHSAQSQKEQDPYAPLLPSAVWAAGPNSVISGPAARRRRYQTSWRR